MAVAVKVTGDPASAPLVAVTVLAPVVAPSVSVARARPLASVAVVVPDSAPPPAVTAHTTGAPETAFPNASVTFTTSFWGNAVFTAPVCAPPLSAAIAVAAAGAMLNVALVAAVSPALVADSVYPAPALLIDSPENVATPATAPTVVVPDSVPPPGLAAIESVTLPVNAVAVAFVASFAVTTIAGAMPTPATALLGWTVNASCDAGNGPAVPVAVAVTASGLGVRPVPLTFSVIAPATPPRVHVVCAMPVPACVTAVVGETLPLPAAGAKFTVTPPTPLPNASATFTTTGCVSAAAPAALCAPPLTSVSALATPGVIVNAGPVTLVRPVAVAVRVHAPAVVCLSPGNVATPATAATVVVPVSACAGSVPLGTTLCRL